MYAAESRSAVTARKRTRLVRPSSARAWSHTRGESTVSRSVAAIPFPQAGGEKRATIDILRQSTNRAVSRRGERRCDAVGMLGGKNAAVFLVVVKDPAGATHHAGQRVLVYV